MAARARRREGVVTATVSLGEGEAGGGRGEGEAGGGLMKRVDVGVGDRGVDRGGEDGGQSTSACVGVASVGS